MPVEILGSSHEVAVHRFILRPAVQLAIAVGTNNDCWFVTVGIRVLVAASAADTTLHAMIIYPITNVIAGERGASASVAASSLLETEVLAGHDMSHNI